MSSLTGALESVGERNLALDKFRLEAREHSSDYLRGYLTHYDSAGTIRRALRNLVQEPVRIEAYRESLKERESASLQ